MNIVKPFPASVLGGACIEMKWCTIDSFVMWKALRRTIALSQKEKSANASYCLNTCITLASYDMIGIML